MSSVINVSRMRSVGFACITQEQPASGGYSSGKLGDWIIPPGPVKYPDWQPVVGRGNGCQSEKKYIKRNKMLTSLSYERARLLKQMQAERKIFCNNQKVF